MRLSQIFGDATSLFMENYPSPSKDHFLLKFKNYFLNGLVLSHRAEKTNMKSRFEILMVMNGIAFLIVTYITFDENFNADTNVDSDEEADEMEAMFENPDMYPLITFVDTSCFDYRSIRQISRSVCLTVFITNMVFTLYINFNLINHFSVFVIEFSNHVISS